MLKLPLSPSTVAALKSSVPVTNCCVEAVPVPSYAVFVTVPAEIAVPAESAAASV